ncbi:selenium-binding family protein [Thioalkalivibrio sp. HK1]|uniref:selenium-binding family protein n=1 Tax=Thioalkalivibrio sp. HK1 TaxID=1469245 RepID=UPI00046E57EC|nr:selenium-binding family protein [Thioalkalivibrio sp. HK1]
MSDKECCGPGYASPKAAIAASREKLLYTTALYVGTGVEKPDYLATIDVDPESPTYSQVIHRLEVPGIGDELHHIGWNACSSCHKDASKERRYLIVPGVRTTNLHIVDCATDPRAPRLHKVIDGAEIKAKTDLSAPHTVHCLGADIIISMLGDAKGEAPGGFLHIDENFEIVGRWENDISPMKFNYDFWYQPRHNMMVSSEWGAPNTFMPGFDLEDVKQGKYGDQIHFWDFAEKSIVKTVQLGEEGMIPLEVRFHHDPDSTHGYVGATLSSNIFHWHKNGGGDWEVNKVIDVPSVKIDGWPIPVPGLITDILVSMDDRFLYFSNWLQGDVRQYDISVPSEPRLVGQVFLGGLPGAPGRVSEVNGRPVAGGPQMIQLSLDGRRLYVTDSLFSTWDNQFYPDMKEKGGCMIQVDCDIETGGLKINPDFFVDFSKEPNGPARCHEMRYPGGDCTSDIWL